MKFVTANSIYEIDNRTCRIRRLTGVNSPTPRQGPDGQWRSYERLLLQRTGELLIIWGGTEGTLTSPGHFDSEEEAHGSDE